MFYVLDHFEGQILITYMPLPMLPVRYEKIVSENIIICITNNYFNDIYIYMYFPPLLLLLLLERVKTKAGKIMMLLYCCQRLYLMSKIKSNQIVDWLFRGLFTHFFFFFFFFLHKPLKLL